MISLSVFVSLRVIAELLLNEAFSSPNHKTCCSFALGCIQNFNFPIHFCPFSPVSTQPLQNCRAKLKSCWHPRTKLKKCFVIGRPQSLIEQWRRKIDSKTSSSVRKEITINIHRHRRRSNIVNE